MAALVDVQWPARFQTERLTLRAIEPRDRPRYVDLLTSPEVRRHLGGAQERDEIESSLPETPGRDAGVFAVEHAGDFLGTVTLDRRDPDRPGHTRPGGLELEVSYALLPQWWGMGCATEAVRGVLGWARDWTSDSSVLICTQLANRRSMAVAQRLGFGEVDRFIEFGAIQWLGQAGGCTPGLRPI
jgi:RimJ/RimL family protein N-acetyltransferase